ncbi:membrane-associated protein, putative, partial [Bodo saltans]
MPPAAASGRARRTFLASLRLLVLGVIVVTFISLPLRSQHGGGGSSSILLPATGGGIKFDDDVPKGDEHQGDSSALTDHHATAAAATRKNIFPPPAAPLETLPVLHFTFPKEALLDTLFTNGDALLNKTHLFPQQETPTLEKSGKQFDRYHNPYTPSTVDVAPHTTCKNGAHLSGRWVHDESLKPKYPSYGEILGCCQRGFEAAGHSADDIRPELKYRWESDSCDLFDWSEEKFCKALRGRDMMIAGDSLNDHWHASLYYLLGGRKDIYKKEGTVRGKRACGTHEICHKYYPRPLRLYFLTNQLLQEERRLFRNYKWW